MDRILVIGGYGAVGRHAATELVHLLPRAEVITAGRHPGRAAPVPGTTAARVDASDPDSLAEALTGVDAVLMCAEQGNASVAAASDAAATITSIQARRTM